MALDGYTGLNKGTVAVNAGTLMVVCGPSGAGKSVRFNAITGLLPVSQA